TFDVVHDRREVDFRWRGTITGEPSGRVEYVLDGVAGKGFPFNRIGICVHHPWRETAGARFTARTPSGELVGEFPDLIGVQRFDGVYYPLFDSYDRLEVSLPEGGSLLLELEGDLWETEDHRNWTDANFKTYSTPIAQGRPAPLEAGQPLRQRLAIEPRDTPAGEVEPAGVRIAIGDPTGNRMPPVGLGQDRDRHELDGTEQKLIAALAPAHLRVEVRLDRDDWREAVDHGKAAAAAIGSSLELSLHLSEEHEPALADLAAALEGGPPVAHALVINADSRTATPAETTRAALVDLVRRALAAVAPRALFAGGTEIYFTEINRTRPELASWDALCYSLTPQIHAFTDVDIVENLDAQAETVRSARAIAGEKPVIVSPATLRRRVNFHAAGEPPPTPPGELPDSVDVRQSSLLGAAWTAGSLKYLAESGAAAVTYYETTGWRGVLERSGGPELPERFRSRPGEVFPLYHPLADASEWRGAEVLVCESTDVLAAVGLAVRTVAGLRLLVANLAPARQEVVVGPLDGAVSLRRLSAATADEAAARPADFRARREQADAHGELALTLEPYEVVRIDST
ncbi:MAG TPA: hypothetical protein VFN99_00855, partial [Gaiella sp.]|nr:hypothetical protein [Gaiella sp.]